MLLMLAVQNVKNELCMFKRWFQDNPKFIRFESCWVFFNLQSQSLGLHVSGSSPQGPVSSRLFCFCQADAFTWDPTILGGRGFHLVGQKTRFTHGPRGRDLGTPILGFLSLLNNKNLESLGDLADVYQHF